MRQLLRDIFSDKVSTTVLNEDKPTRNADHPTMKPLKLLARLVKNSSRQGDSVLDTFGGSGSTLITCEQLGRRCFTMELDPRYADVIVKRYINFTGADTVTLIRNGQKNIVTCSLILGV
jgi:DNA modification methylase